MLKSSPASPRSPIEVDIEAMESLDNPRGSHDSHGQAEEKHLLDLKKERSKTLYEGNRDPMKDSSAEEVVRTDPVGIPRTKETQYAQESAGKSLSEELTLPGVAIDREESSRSPAHSIPVSAQEEIRSSVIQNNFASSIGDDKPASESTVSKSSSKSTKTLPSDTTPSLGVMAVIEYKEIKNRCPEIIYTLPQVKAEMYCTKCNTKSPIGRPRSSTCFLCGDDVTTTQNGVTESEITLSGLETLVYQCKKHNEFAWQRGFSRMCVLCRRPISDSFFCSFAIKCAACSFGDSSSSARCCKILSEDDD